MNAATSAPLTGAPAADITAHVGDTTGTPAITGGNGGTKTYLSSNPAKVAVDAAGHLSFLAVTITVTDPAVAAKGTAAQTVHYTVNVIAALAAPTATGVSLSGTTTVGQVLTVHYTFSDVNGDHEGTTTFKWYRDTTLIAGATASTYTLVAADEGHTITFGVTPVSSVAPVPK